MGGLQNGTFASFLCDVFSLLTRPSQYLEHPWVVKILLLVFLRNNALVLSKVNKPFSNMAQASQGDGNGWHSMWENMGRCLENFLPAVVWNFIHELLQDPDEVIKCSRKKSAVAIPRRHNLQS